MFGKFVGGFLKKSVLFLGILCGYSGTFLEKNLGRGGFRDDVDPSETI